MTATRTTLPPTCVYAPAVRRDEVTVAFKAEKDLATTAGGLTAGSDVGSPVGSTVEMEPKLPVD